jgi:hypothetical protein
MKHIIICITICSVLLNKSFAQTTVLDKSAYATQLEKTIDFFKGSNYSYRIKYKSYFGHNSTIVRDEFKGIMIRNDKSMYCEMPGKHIVQDEHVRILVSEESRSLVLIDPDYKFHEEVELNQYNEHLEQAQRIEMTAKGNEKVITLYMKTKYEIEKQELILNEDGLVSKMIIYYSEMHTDTYSTNSDKKDKVKLVIELYDYRKNITTLPNQQTTYFLAKKGKDYVSTNAFASYQIIDYRIEK